LLALRQPRAAAAFWLTMLVVWLLNALTHNFEDRKVTWLLFGLIAVGARLWHSPAPAQRAAPAPRRVTPGGVPTPT